MDSSSVPASSPEPPQALPASPPFSCARRTAWLAAAALWACIYLPGLGSLELQGNEAKRILPALHMIASGDWLIPELGGVTYINKPPLIYWMVAGSFLASGSRTELPARMPSVLMILAFASVLILMPSTFFGVPARLAAALIFMTIVSFIEKGRQIEIEASFVAVTGIATVWWLNAWAAGSSRWATWFVPCIVLGIGLLLKGPLILLFFYAVVLMVLARTRRLRDALVAPHLLGIVVMLAMLLWWVVYVWLTKAGASANLQYEVGSRFTPKDIDYAGWMGTWLKVLVDFLPWALLLPFLWSRTWMAALPARQQQVFAACRLALVVAYVLVNAMPATRSRYSMPLFPLAALLLGWLLAAQPPRPLLSPLWRRLVLSAVFVCLIASVVGALLMPTGFLFMLIGRFGGPHIAVQATASQYILASGVFVAASVAAAAAMRLRHWLYSPLNLAVATGVVIAVVMLGFAAFALPVITSFESKRPVGVKINGVIPAGEPVHICSFAYEPFLFYIHRPIVPVSSNSIPAGVRWLLVPNEELPELRKLPRLGQASIALDVTYRKKNRYILLDLREPGPK